jgi:hypothetical protein
VQLPGAWRAALETAGIQDFRFRDLPHSAASYKKKVTCRERFLAAMEQVVPWARTLAALESHYSPNAAGRTGRPPIGLARMLRM